MRDVELAEIVEEVANLLGECLRIHDVARDEAVDAVQTVVEFFEERAGVERWRFAHALAKATSERGGRSYDVALAVLRRQAAN